MLHTRFAWLAFFLLALGATAGAAKTHSVTFGKTWNVKLFVGSAENVSLDLKVRPLLVDGRIKEFTTGDPHDVTEQVFVVQRAYRVNDSLPDDPRGVPKWRWQRGGWLLVDRVSGRVSKVNLPDFDPFYSAATWYREFAAYCGTSPDGAKLFAVVAQLGVRKPLVRQQLGPTESGDLPDSECEAPQWQRRPTRVTFLPRRGQKLTFEIHGRSVDTAPVEEAEE